MDASGQPVCFVVMGFGRKTDYESGRALDLDATYSEIIAPAAEAKGYRCIRGDKISHTGLIDLPMYEMLLRADLVIADISTGNVNAVYELGVRHALRPRSTIIMKESRGRLYFDLNHINTFEYEHLGDDIGSREARRAKAALAALIDGAENSRNPDSPVYTFLPKLQQPRLTDEEYESLLDSAEDEQARLATLLEAGETAIKSSDFGSAVLAFSSARELRPGDTYILQRLALSTYKAAKPSKFSALIDALRIIEDLHPDETNDPETTGLAGAIHKRLWQESKDPVQLERASRLYRRGFEIRRDYYNGENLALCYDWLAEAASGSDRVFYRISAMRTRQEVVALLKPIIESDTFQERSDHKWIFATLAHCLFALGQTDEAIAVETKFREERPAAWEVQTFEEGKSAAQRAREMSESELEAG
ncbi:tetratricopeptide repeat-containing protein [Lysobacter hankyongensis]